MEGKSREKALERWREEERIKEEMRAYDNVVQLHPHKLSRREKRLLDRISKKRQK